MAAGTAALKMRVDVAERAIRVGFSIGFAILNICFGRRAGFDLALSI
jgi:hypothetical protein